MTQDEIRTAIASDARKAGMVDDADAIKLVNVSGIKLAVDGTPVVPGDFWRNVRREKPHLFKKVPRYGGPDFNARTASFAEVQKAEQEMLNDLAARR